MKFDAIAVTPGFANTCQNGTDPSAKSSHVGVDVITLQFACRGLAGALFSNASASATTTGTRSPSFFTRDRLAPDPGALTNALPMPVLRIALQRAAQENRARARGRRGGRSG